MGFNPGLGGGEAVGIEARPLLTQRREHPSAAACRALGRVDDGRDHGKQEEPNA